MAEIDDLIRGALGGLTVEVDIGAAGSAVRSRIAAGEVGPRLEVAPGWRLSRFGFAAHRAAWTVLAAVLAVVVAAAIVWVIRSQAPIAPGSGMTPSAPASVPSGPVVTTSERVAPRPGPHTGADGPLSSSIIATPSTPLTGRSTAVTTVDGDPPIAVSSAPRTSKSATPGSAVTAPAAQTTTTAARTTTTAARTTTTAARTTTTAARTTTTAVPTTITAARTTTTAVPTTETAAPPLDNQAPAIVSAFASAQVVDAGNTVTLVVQATDNVRVTGVQLTWSAGDLGLPPGRAAMTQSATGWLWTWTAPALDQNGTVTFVATARGAAGHRSEPATINVAVRVASDGVASG